MTDRKETQRTKQPWPTKDAMEQVYAKKLWGGQDADFYSGTGSHLPELVEPYVQAVKEFLASFEEPLTVCDLGCGDFNVGSRLAPHCNRYVAVDIVPELIARNRQRYQAQNLTFHCLDMAVDPLPAGDCAILRQVLQHLSNAEVARIVHQLSAYRYVIVTEHVPHGAFIPNSDILSGQGIRLKKNSGLDLLAAPFNLRPRSERLLTSLAAPDGKGVIRTTVYEMR